MTDPPESPIARRDELLELLYWLEGEGFDSDATLGRLARFLTYPEHDVQHTLDRLIERGEVRQEGDGDPRYRLTEPGRREAARRFAEEFAPLLSQGHGECNDPAGECHTDPTAAVECHARRNPTIRATP